METTRAAMPSAASRSRACIARPTSDAGGQERHLGVRRRRPVHRRPWRERFSAVWAVRTVGTSWREKASRLGRSALSQRDLPAFRRLHAVGGAHHQQVGNGAQRRQMLDRLVGRAVLAHADGIMRHHEDDADAHQRGEADRRAAIIGEHQEGAAIGNDAAMQRHAVHRRRHAMLADAVMDIAAGEIARR